MGNEATMLYDTADSIATITISNPGKKNAIRPDMWRAVPSLVERAQQDRNVKVLVFRGEGGVFSSGADITELTTIAAAGGCSPAGSSSSAGTVESEADLTSIAEQAVANCAKPTVALIEGICFGGGLELAAACDFRVASQNARFCIPAANIGLVYPLTAMQRLVSVVGATHAKYMLCTAAVLPAADALRTGLVNQVIDDAEFEAQSERFVRTLSAKSQFSVHATNAIIDAIAVSPDEAAATFAAWESDSRSREDLQAGIRGFLAKEPPAFTWAPK